MTLVAPSLGRRLVLASAACVAAIGSSGVSDAQVRTSAPPRVDPQEARDIAVEAYLYFYPLVMMGVTRAQTNAVPGAAPNSLSNSFFHIRAFPPADFKAVVRSNFDTLYSSAWLDLTKGPMIVSVPDTEGRYYTLPMLDMWTDVFAAPGKRTTGTAARQFALVPRGWSHALPERVARIEAPTPYVWICGRTQTNGPRDYPTVHKIQDGYRIMPLSRWGQPLSPVPVQPSVHLTAPAPRQQVDKMTPFAFFRYAAELLRTNPPHLTDWSIIARLRRIGIEMGRLYDPERLDSTIQQALIDAVANGQKAMQARLESGGNIVNGWQIDTRTIGVYGNDYLKRALVAQILLGANQPEDAIYPLIVTDADGNPPMGQNKYVLHFAKGGLPPAEAFWSLSMYDAEGYQVANPLNRFALRDRDALNHNADGSLDLYVQHDTPGDDRVANWLPSPSAGVLGLTMRLYAPKAEALNGNWAPPPLLRQS
jgi:hypothetical protein